MHLLNDYCFRHELAPPLNHRERLDFVETRLPTISFEYNELYILSISTRYTSRYSKISDKNVSDAKEWFQNISTHINNV